MTDCPRFGKLFNGCKFEERFDEQPNGYKLTEASGFDAAAIHHMTHFKIYVHDICIRCGKTVKRQ